MFVRITDKELWLACFASNTAMWKTDKTLNIIEV